MGKLTDYCKCLLKADGKCDQCPFSKRCAMKPKDHCEEQLSFFREINIGYNE